MARYVIPSVAIPYVILPICFRLFTFRAIYSAYRSYFYGSDEIIPVRSIETAVSSLNKNENIEEATRFLYHYRESKILWFHTYSKRGFQHIPNWRILLQRPLQC